MSEFVCPVCNQSGFIVSVEVLTEAFPCGPDGKGGIDYESHGKIRHTERTHYECRYCGEHFIEAEVLALDVVE